MDTELKSIKGIRLQVREGEGMGFPDGFRDYGRLAELLSCQGLQILAGRIIQRRWAGIVD